MPVVLRLASSTVDLRYCNASILHLINCRHSLVDRGNLCTYLPNRQRVAREMEVQSGCVRDAYALLHVSAPILRAQSAPSNEILCVGAHSEVC